MMSNLNNTNRYNKDSGFGENRKLEMDVIKHYFGARLLTIEPVDDKERQVKGIDYIVTIDDGDSNNNNGGKRTLNIDTKIHHYDSDIFVFEYDDTRENYKNRTWTNGEKETDILFWIMPAKNKYCVYSESSLIEFRNSMNWNFYDHLDVMDVKQYSYGKLIGKTINKWLPLNFTFDIGKRYFTREMPMGNYNCKIKPSYYYWNEITRCFRKKIM